MILLITTSSHGHECAAALLAATHIKSELAPDMRTALGRLREQEFSAVIFDESLLEPSAKTIDMLVRHLGRAVPVFVNLAVSRMERVVRDVQAALRRAEQERSLARQAVESDLRSQLRGELTGILLWTQQAMETPAVPVSAQSKLKSVYEAADKMRARLSIGAN
jgi:DNA-binding NtrC family response regulator